MTADTVTLTTGLVALLLAYLAGWVRGRAGRGTGSVEPTYYPPLPGRGYQPRATANRLPIRATGAVSPYRLQFKECPRCGERSGDDPRPAPAPMPRPPAPAKEHDA
jgi:hypothetical protein